MYSRTNCIEYTITCFTRPNFTRLNFLLMENNSNSLADGFVCKEPRKSYMAHHTCLAPHTLKHSYYFTNADSSTYNKTVISFLSFNYEKCS